MDYARLMRLCYLKASLTNKFFEGIANGSRAESRAARGYEPLEPEINYHSLAFEEEEEDAGLPSELPDETLRAPEIELTMAGTLSIIRTIPSVTMLLSAKIR